MGYTIDMNNTQQSQTIITSIPGFASRNPINVHPVVSLAGNMSIRKVYNG